MARLKEIVIDARHPAAQARFWAAALTDFEVRPYDDREIARLAALGLTPETDPAVLLDGPGPSICFHVRQVPRATTNHIHLDLVGDPRELEVARLTALGAQVRDQHEAYTVMLDPEGNAFCVVDPS
jgi:hypothetical protein